MIIRYAFSGNYSICILLLSTSETYQAVRIFIMTIVCTGAKKLNVIYFFMSQLFMYMLKFIHKSSFYLLDINTFLKQYRSVMFC